MVYTIEFIGQVDIEASSAEAAAQAFLDMSDEQVGALVEQYEEVYPAPCNKRGCKNDAHILVNRMPLCNEHIAVVA